MLFAVRTGNVTEAVPLKFYEGKVAGWQKPDRAIRVDKLPLEATGKVERLRLCDTFADVRLKGAA